MVPLHKPAIEQVLVLWLGNLETDPLLSLDLWVLLLYVLLDGKG